MFGVKVAKFVLKVPFRIVSVSEVQYEVSSAYSLFEA